MTKKSSLFEPRRQSGYAIIMILLKFARLLVRQLWPILLIAVVNRGSSWDTWFMVVILAIGFFSLVGSIVAYFKFYYLIQGDQLHIDKGLFKRTSLDIPFDRIQTVDFEQNVIHQIFNVVRVNIDSAGTKGSEISFDALTMEDANELRDYILSQKAEILGDEIDETVQEEQELILRLDEMDLLKIGISQNHLRTAGILFGAMWALGENISQIFGRDIYEVIGEEAEGFIRGSFILILIIIPIFPYYFICHHPVQDGSSGLRPAVYQDITRF